MANKKQAQTEKQNKVTFEEFTKRYRYDPETGHFYDIRPVDVFDNSNGYKKISVTIDGDRHFVKSHRAAFLCMTGEWPKDSVDHINRNRSNNKWNNLRNSSHSQNMHNVPLRPNNKSGYRGVFYRKDMRKWTASIGIENNRIYLGAFNSAEEANAAYEMKAKELQK